MNWFEALVPGLIQGLIWFAAYCAIIGLLAIIFG